MFSQLSKARKILCPFVRTPFLLNSMFSIQNEVDRVDDQTSLNKNSNAQQIKSLKTLILKRNDYNLRDLFESNSQHIFIFGMNPLEFRLHYYTYFKYGFWLNNSNSSQRLLKFIDRCDQQEKRIQETTKEDGRVGEKIMANIREYRKYIATQILPSIISEYQYTNVYLNQLHKFLQGTSQLSELQTIFILNNLYRIIFGSNQFQYYNNEKDNAWLITHAFQLLLDHCLPTLNKLPFSIKSKIISVARSLRINHVKLLQFLKKDIQKDRKQISLQVFLAALLYLGYHNSFPYEYFYRNKDSLMSFIEAAEDFSQKKVTVSMNMMQIFSRHRLMYCQNILHRLLVCIEYNLMASTINQLSRIFYFYSRLKSGVEHRFVVKIVERIFGFIDELDSKHYLLIIKAVANLNYHDEVLIQKLKDYDYQLFLTSLKFGCESLGSYYAAILKEVDDSFNKRTQIPQNESTDKIKSIPSEKLPFPC